MSAIEDVLAKPEWPLVDDQKHDIILNHLGSLCSRGTDSTFKVGFNDSMLAIENKQAKAIFVARSDLNAAECMPLALSSAAYKIPLITLKKGSKQKLGTGVAVACGADEPLLRAVEGIGSAKLDWVYHGASLIQKKKTKKPKSKKSDNA